MKQLYKKCAGGFCSIHTSENIKSGEIVYILSDENKLSEPTRTSIQVSEDIHIEDDIGKLINHSCRPSCEIKGYNIIALRDIHRYTEITFDYTKSETRLSSPFECNVCGGMVEKFGLSCRDNK